MLSVIEYLRNEPNAGVVLSTLLLVAGFKMGYEVLKNGFKSTTNTDQK